MPELSNIPCWVIWISVGLTVFHVVQGIIGQTYLNIGLARLPKTWQKIVVFYLHDILLHAICTIFGCVSLIVAYRLASSGLSQLPTASAILVVSLFLIGIAGVTGQLAGIFAKGELPLS